MARAVLVLALALAAACGTRGSSIGPVARPAPVEIDWPDAGAITTDAGSASPPAVLGLPPRD